jgi:hypothetical protein
VAAGRFPPLVGGGRDPRRSDSSGCGGRGRHGNGGGAVRRGFSSWRGRGGHPRWWLTGSASCRWWGQPQATRFGRQPDSGIYDGHGRLDGGGAA